VLQFFLQRIEPGPGSRGRKLEAFRWHVTVGTRTPVSTKFFEVAITESFSTSRHRIARAFVAIEFYLADSFWLLSAARMRRHRRNHPHEGKTKESD
jgi:hypothetical protein